MVRELAVINVLTVSRLEKIKSSENGFSFKDVELSALYLCLPIRYGSCSPPFTAYPCNTASKLNQQLRTEKGLS